MFNSLPVDQRPYKRWAAITPNDTTIYAPPPDALYLMVSSNSTYLNMQGSDGVDVVFGFPNAGLLHYSPSKIMNTNTTLPGGLIGLWKD